MIYRSVQAPAVCKMSQKTLSLWLKAIIWGMAVCGLLIYFGVFPTLGRDLASQNQEFSYCFWPWLIFLWITAVPCYLVLIWGWKIAVSIGNDRSFTRKNAAYLKYIMIAAVSDTVFFLCGNLLFLFLNMNHPGILVLALFVCFAGACVAVVAGSLSHLVAKAAAMREENESFI